MDQGTEAKGRREVGANGEIRIKVPVGRGGVLDK